MAGLLKRKGKKKIKRGGRKNKNQSFVLFSTNAAGMKCKMESLKSELKSQNVAAFTIQETHFPKKGKLKIENYEIFEAIRKKNNGGTMIGVQKSLNPMLIKEYSEEFELLVVEIKIRNKEIRIITGYGPQECWSEAERIPFFIALEEEIAKAELQGKSIIIEMDSNSKLGPTVIPQDPHEQSPNGKILSGIIQRHGLIVANGIVNKCKGAITRRRETIDAVEESIIDHVIISNDLVENLESLIIDEEKNNALMKITKTKSGIVKKHSDHNAIIGQFNFNWNKRMKIKRVEMYNLKNKECQSVFKELTSSGNFLSEIFDDKTDLNESVKLFIKKINECVKKSFRKIRITDKPNKEIEELFEKRKKLKNKNDLKSKSDLEKIETELAELCAKDNYNKIKEEIADIKCEEGGINSGKLWKLKKKLSPKCRDPPTAMLDKEGNLVTDPERIANIGLEVFKDRLKNRDIKEDLVELKDEKNELCKLRLKLAGNKKTPDWTMKQLETVLKYLKRNKSRDPFEYANEIFKEDVAGKDLKLALLKLFNRIKSEQKFPEALEIYDISAIYKNKGNRNDFEFYRGIFRVPIFRTILDRLIYNDEYEEIDEALTDSNVGARKGRNIRDNIFVLNAVTNSIINGDEEPVDVQVYDVEKCFDALWVEECINDLFETGFDNDKLPLLYLENKNANIAVKTSHGKSRRESIQNVIMQGTVWGSLCCTTSMDKLGNIIYNNEDLLYKYKQKVDIPSLGMVDDILSIQKCSSDSVKINAVINAFIESKKLTLSRNKCHRIHIQKKSNDKTECLALKVHDNKMSDSNKEKYLGDIVDNSGTIRKTIEERKNKGYAIVAEILAILEEIPLGKYRLEIGLRLRQAMLLNGILFNSEAWHNISENEVKILETVDEYLLRSLVKAHSKTPLEFLYLEAGATPVRFILACRRMIYLQTILKRKDEELTKRIYNAQRESATAGDFYQLVKADYDLIGESLDEEYIESTSINAHKRNIKEKIKNAAFEYLLEKQRKHSKVEDVKYETFAIQKYMTSPLFTNDEVCMLYALRSRAVDCKANYKTNYHKDDLQCKLCGLSVDDQPHILLCDILRKELKSHHVTAGPVEYCDIFKDTHKQKVVTALFIELIKIKKKLETDKNPSTCATQVLRNSYDLQDCIVDYSSGK